MELPSKNLSYYSFLISPNIRGKDRKIFINIEHDAALLNWLEEKKRYNISDFFLITIDDHIDLTFFDENILEKLYLFRNQLDSLKINDLKDFIISNNFHRHSVSFITAAMELGIVNHVLIISPNHSRFHWREDEEISYRRLRCLKTKFKIYKDTSSYEHKIYFIPYMHHLWQKSTGILTDIVDKKKIALREKIYNSHLIIDIDLDYCTYTRDFKTFVISKNNFNWEFDNQKFIDLLNDKADIISLSLEPLYCGGFNNSKKILDYFLWFFDYIGLMVNIDAIRNVLDTINT